MATINTTDPKPGFVYNSIDDTWYPLSGIAPASTISQWVKTAVGGETSVSGVGDNATTLSYTAGTEQVYLNGVLLVRNSDYTATNGTSITGFSPALAASDVVEVITYNPSNIQITNAVLKTDISAKADLIVGTADDTYGILNAPSTSGYILSYAPAQATGLAWIPNDQGDITAVTSGVGITVVNSTGPIPQVVLDDTVAATTSNTLTMSNKTLTTPTINYPLIKSAKEIINVTGTAFATGTNNIDFNTAGVYFFNSNATGSGTLNFRGDGSTTLSSLVAVGSSATIGILIQNGSTAYYPATIQIDGTTVTPKWQGGTAPTAGNASSTDIYAFNIIKTAATPTYSVFASQTKFA